MTWTGKECKAWAKEALNRNYWKIVLVSFLMLIFCGGFSGHGFKGAASASGTGETQEAEISIDAKAADKGLSETPPFSETADSGSTQTGEPSSCASVIIPEKARAVGITIFILIAIFAFILLYILQALLVNPFRVGIGRFMIKSIDDRAEVREIAYGFDHSYKNIVKTMFHYDLRVFLWSLLFIIPGFYKEYQYRLVPYLLAEHPDMNYQEALRKSRELMDGHKWKAFVLDLSFILWHIFGFITCGIGEIFYVSPYHNLTLAALYRKLSGEDFPKPEEIQAFPADTLLS